MSPGHKYNETLEYTIYSVCGKPNYLKRVRLYAVQPTLN